MLRDLNSGAGAYRGSTPTHTVFWTRDLEDVLPNSMLLNTANFTMQEYGHDSIGTYTTGMTPTSDICYEFEHIMLLLDALHLHKLPGAHGPNASNRNSTKQGARAGILHHELTFGLIFSAVLLW